MDTCFNLESELIGYGLHYLQTLFPGLWLTEITPDLYKVPEDQ